MPDFMKIIPELEGKIREHFPKVDIEVVKKEANVIYDEWSVMSGWQEIERSDRDPKEDIKSIEIIEDKLIAAAKKIDGVGYFGAKALHDLAQEQAKRATGAPDLLAISAMDAPSILKAVLSSLAAEMKEARKAINPNALSVNSAFDSTQTDRRTGGRHRETAARHTANECANVFARLEGKRGTRITDEEHKAYGPFLDFVSGIFDVLGITASPEATIKAIMEKTPKQS